MEKKVQKKSKNNLQILTVLIIFAPLIK